jgi:hypothetical protein
MLERNALFFKWSGRLAGEFLSFSAAWRKGVLKPGGHRPGKM